MSQPVALTLEDGSIIFVQSNDDIDVPLQTYEEEVGRTPKGPTRGGGGVVPPQSIEALQKTIRGYTSHIMSAFEGGPIRPFGAGKVEKVTLEFGVTMAGKAGIPCITEATATGSLKVTVECKWPNGNQ
ncbi:MAG: CU044_2847 family protein [Cyanobacteria bacterium J06632_3]